MKNNFIIILLLIPSVHFSGPTRAQHEFKSANDPIISTALGLISADSVEKFMQDLQDMGTRFMIAENRKEVSSWIMKKFMSFGITDVKLDSFNNTMICQQAEKEF